MHIGAMHTGAMHTGAEWKDAARVARTRRSEQGNKLPYSIGKMLPPEIMEVRDV